MKEVQENSKRQNVQLVHNKGVSYFEECLKLGDMLLRDERRALYKYLLDVNRDLYSSQSISLLNSGNFTRRIANGEACYFVKNGTVSYSARRLNSNEVSTDIREIKLSRFLFRNVRHLRKFFAQCDVDIIQNFPIPSPIPQEESGYGINVNPYYSLAYYSNGKNLVAGLIKKIRTNDKEILTKLRAL